MNAETQPIRECADNDSPWLICKPCAAEGKCKQAEPQPDQRQQLEDLRMLVLDWQYDKNCPAKVVSEIDRMLAAGKDEPQPDLLECGIVPRPLAHPLRDYHIAISEGPLNYTWKDKPHRLIYDLIAAVRYYAAPQAQQPLTDEQIEGCIDSANRKFKGRRQGPCGQQITTYDDWKYWLVREIEAALGIGVK